MTMEEYLKEESMALSELCKITGIKHDTMSKYKYGLRIPNLTNMNTYPNCVVVLGSL